MKYFITLLFSVAILNVFSSTSFWQNVSSDNLKIEGERKIIPQISSVIKLEDVSFRALQQNIPSEQSGRYLIIRLPAPDGSLRNFRVFERSTMEAGLAERYPSIKTYQGISVDNPMVTAKLDYTEFGFHAMVFSNEGIYFIDPYTNSNTGYYNCYYKKNYTKQIADYSVCATKTPTDNININNPSAYRLALDNQSATDIISDGKIRTFRLALACTIEYSAAVGGPTPTKATVLSAMVTTMNRVNGVYEKELSIHMNLVTKEDTLIFITSDSYSNTNGGTMLGQNQTVCDQRIGSANYDIGHVFSTGGGGVAGLGVVCVSGSKANGVTGSGNPTGDGFDIDYVAHEMGHQFGGNHTFNGNTGSCSGNRNASTAYEVGSGTTIMAYAGICTGNDPQQHSDDYFHRASLKEIFNYISGTSCAVISTPGTVAPTVSSYVSTYYIPYKTDFEVTASATDPAGHPLTYCWEEYDIGPAGSWNATNNTTAPILRSFNPKSSGTRVFPIWDSLIKNNIKYLGEVLPEVARDTKLRCTVRGLDPNGWGMFSAPETDLTLKSIVTTSLFRVTSQATATTITGNTSQIVTWDVAGTTASPISSANVNIYLSLDSARTFPYLLASATSNDGSETVSIPDINTNNKFSARIKVKGNGNVFFDLNNGWIKVNQSAPVFAASFTSPNSGCQGSSITFTNTSTGSPDSVRWSISGGTPSTSTSLTTIQSIFNTAGTFTISLTAYKAGVASTPFTGNVIVNPIKTTNISSTICQGDSVTVGSSVYKTTGVFTTHLQTSLACDSAVILNLTVNPTKTTNISSTICQGDSVTVGSSVYKTTGVFTTHLQTSLACDSAVILNLTVNPTKTTNISSTICQGDSVTVGSSVFKITGVFTTHLQTSLACDSAVTLNLTVNPTMTTNISRTICQGDSVTVGSTVFKITGVFTTHLQTSLACDSAVILKLTVNPTKTTNISRTICQGDSVIVGSSVFKITGVFTTHLQTSLACDSVVILNLTVNPKKITNISQAICSGESVTIGTQTFNTDGLHTVVLQTSSGCDSTVNLSLTVKPIPAIVFSPTGPVICAGTPIDITARYIAGATCMWSTGSGSRTITVSPTVNTYYSITVTNDGCSSKDSVLVKVNPTRTTSVSRIICQGESVTIGSSVYTTTGISTTHLQTSLSCDSAVILNLTVNPTKTTSISRTICQGESVTIGTSIYTTTGISTTHLQTSLMCDSAIILNLTVNPTKTTNLSRTICQGESVTIGTSVYTATGISTTHLQTSLTCDSAVVLNLTVNPLPSTPSITQSNDTLYSNIIIAGAIYYWYKSGVLTATTSTPYYTLTATGLYTLKINKNNCESAVSASFNAVVTGIKVNKTELQFAVVPNPNSGQFELRVTAEKNDSYQLVLYNVTGQEIKKEEMNVQKGLNVKQFNLNNIEKGMYFISLIGKEGVATQNIIVQ